MKHKNDLDECPFLIYPILEYHFSGCLTYFRTLINYWAAQAARKYSLQHGKFSIKVMPRNMQCTCKALDVVLTYIVELLY